MSPAVPLLLKLVTAHLLGDFLFQTARMASDKRRASVFLRHLAVHGVLLVAVGLSERGGFTLWLGLLLVFAAHGAIDAWSRLRARSLTVLVADQALHLASFVAAVAIARPEELESALWRIRVALGDPSVYWLAAGFVTAVWAGAIVVGRWVEPFATVLEADSGDPRPGLRRAGRAIGLFERALIFVAILVRVESLVGFVIAAKALLRLPEARESSQRALAEYYLVGSLASAAWAVIVALVVRWTIGA